MLWRGPTQVYHVLTVENCNNLSGLTECFMSLFIGTSSPPPPLRSSLSLHTTALVHVAPLLVGLTIVNTTVILTPVVTLWTSTLAVATL